MPEKHDTPANLDANQYYLKPFHLRAFGNVVRGLFIGAALGAGIVLFGLVSAENKGVSVVTGWEQRFVMITVAAAVWGAVMSLGMTRPTKKNVGLSVALIVFAFLASVAIVLVLNYSISSEAPIENVLGFALFGPTPLAAILCGNKQFNSFAAASLSEIEQREKEKKIIEVGSQDPERPQIPSRPNTSQDIGWPQIVEALRLIESSRGHLFDSPLYRDFPYQTIFLAACLGRALDEPSILQDVPFGPVTPQLIERANQYITNPHAGGDAFALRQALREAPLTSERYKLNSDGRLYRDVSVNTHALDMAICQIAGCLNGRRNFSILDHSACMRFAVEAVEQYVSIPIVAYFFSLPYTQTLMQYKKKMVPGEQMLPIYMGTEGLLLEFYGELGQGEQITDEQVRKRIKNFFH